MSEKRSLEYPKRMVKHQSFYRGTLMDFQHYLNTHHFVLPFEARADGGSQLYQITEWYYRGILTKVLIERKREFREKSNHYLNQDKEAT